jgi:hypothetical protein
MIAARPVPHRRFRAAPRCSAAWVRRADIAQQRCGLEIGRIDAAHLERGIHRALYMIAAAYNLKIAVRQPLVNAEIDVIFSALPTFASPQQGRSAAHPRSRGSPVRSFHCQLVANRPRSCRHYR